MTQQSSLDGVLLLLSELSEEVKKHKEQKLNDAEFNIQKATIMKIRTLLASLDRIFSSQNFPYRIMENA